MNRILQIIASLALLALGFVVLTAQTGAPGSSASNPVVGGATIFGTPAAGQLGVWQDSTHIKGTSTLAVAMNTSVGYQVGGAALASTHLSDATSLAYLGNAQSFTSLQTFPAGTACSSGGFNFSGQGSTTFFYAPSATSMGLCLSNVITHVFLTSGFLELGASGGLVFGSGNANTTKDTGVTRKAAGFVVAGTGASGSLAGYFQGANTAAVTAADVTCGTTGTIADCTTAKTITGLTFTLPLSAVNWAMDCDLVVGQATAATANQWLIQTATNGVTNTTASYTMATAATAMAVGAVTDQASTTTAFQIAPSWTLGGTATKMPVHIHAYFEGVSVSGTVINLQVIVPTVGDLLTIYRGASCSLHP